VNGPPTATPTNPAARPRRFLPRFSLRALLLATTVVCLWLGLLVAGAQRQRRAVEAIEASGGQGGLRARLDFEAGYYLIDLLTCRVSRQV
jgi:hypothetical protein